MKRSQIFSRRLRLLLALIGGVIIIALVIFVLPSHEDDGLRIDVDIIVVEETAPGKQAIVHLNLMTHDKRILFDVPARSDVTALDVSVDGRQLVFAMNTPLGRTGAQFARSGLYRIDIAQPAAPDLVLGTNNRDILYDTPRWSPGGDALYFVETNLTNPVAPIFVLARHELATQNTTSVVVGATSPNISPDGNRLVYIGINSETQQRAIYVADSDGRHARALVDDPTLFDLRALLFSHDGETIFFSAFKDEVVVNDASLWRDILGVSVAQAHPGHVVPSEWWRVPVDGGAVERLSQQEAAVSILSADLAANAMLIFVTPDGLFALPTNEDAAASPLIVSQTYRTLAVMPR